MTKPPMSLVQIFLFGERVHLLQQLQYKGVSIQDNGKRYHANLYFETENNESFQNQKLRNY